MAGLEPVINRGKYKDSRVKPGHDGVGPVASGRALSPLV